MITIDAGLLDEPETADVLQWLVDNVGESGFIYRFSSWNTPWKAGEHAHNTILAFREAGPHSEKEILLVGLLDPDDAVLFKLTHGGE